MTFREKVAIEHPASIDGCYMGGVGGCPAYYGYEVDPPPNCFTSELACQDCWDREMPENKEEEKEMINYACPEYKACDHIDNANNNCDGCNNQYKGAVVSTGNIVKVSTIKDSGDRTKFETGAVRDLRANKGRCDLAPLHVIAKLIRHTGNGNFVDYIADFMDNQTDTSPLYAALNNFCCLAFNRNEYGTMLLEVAIHFEQGALKYEEDNWKKGIPVKCYIDSTLRHFYKWMRGDADERHDRAVCWNLMCCIWEVDYHKETTE